MDASQISLLELALHRHSDRVVMPGTPNVLYSINKRGPPSATVTAAAGSVLCFTVHITGGDGLEEFDALKDAGYLVTWVKHKQTNRFTALVNGALLRPMPALSSLPLAPSDPFDLRSLRVPLDFLFTFADLDRIHHVLHDTTRTLIEIGSMSFPVGALSDGRRIVVVFGVEFKQSATRAAPGTGHSRKLQRLATNTDIVYHLIEGNRQKRKVFNFSDVLKDQVYSCPYVISSADQYDPQEQTRAVDTSWPISQFTALDLVLVERGTAVQALWGEESYLASVERVESDRAYVYWDIDTTECGYVLFEV